MNIKQLQRELELLGDTEKAVFSGRYFKSGPGQYGEGDAFRGITVPQIRTFVKSHKGLPLETMEELLHSRYNEDRAAALLLMAAAYTSASVADQTRLYRLYLANTAYINNWNLVDCSAEYIVGPYLQNRSRAPLYKLARSKSLWERRIALLSTFHYIKQGEFSDTLALAEMMLDDKEDLIHKAAGWMLREAGKRGGLREEKEFLKKHYQRMPRTMLRYAIERFPEEERRRYLQGLI